MTHKLADFRKHYPILENKTYLCSHSLGAVPRQTADALQEYYQHWATLGIEAWDGPWWNAIPEFSNAIGQVLNAPDGTVVPMTNATRGMAAIASCFDYSKPRRKIVLTTLEFTTTFPFWRGQEKLGAELVVVESPDGVTVPVEAIVDAIDDETLLVFSSHVYFRSGAVQDLKAIAAAAHKHGAYVLGDGYQAAGTVPVDVQDLDLDFYVGGSHKWLCGGPGAAFLYVKKELIPQMQPRLTGWFGLANPFEYETGTKGGALHDTAVRFLGGTVGVSGLFAAREGIKLVLEAGLDNIRAISKEMTSDIINRSLERDIEVHTPMDPDARSGMICLRFPGSKEASEKLLAADVVIDWRPDCGLRVSPHFYNVEADIDRFFEILDAARS